MLGIWLGGHCKVETHRIHDVTVNLMLSRNNYQLLSSEVYDWDYFELHKQVLNDWFRNLIDQRNMLLF